MNKEETKELEILDMQPEVKEFVRTAGQRTDMKKTLERKRRKRNADYQPWILLAAICLNFIIIILCSILFAKIPALTVILVVVLESVLAFCLGKTYVWTHGVVILLNIVLGIIFSMVVFMILASEIYLVGVAAMHQIDR